MKRLTRRVDGSVVFPSELVGVTITPDNEYMYALLQHLAAIEDILGDEYDLEWLWKLVEADREG